MSGLKYHFQRPVVFQIGQAYYSIPNPEKDPEVQEFSEYFAALQRYKYSMGKMLARAGLEFRQENELNTHFLGQLKSMADKLGLELIEDQQKARYMYESENVHEDGPPAADEESLFTWLDEQISHYIEDINPEFGPASEELRSIARSDAVKKLRRILRKSQVNARAANDPTTLAIYGSALKYLDNLPEEENPRKPAKETSPVFIGGQIKLLEALMRFGLDNFQKLDKKVQARYLAHLLQCSERQVKAALNRERKRLNNTDQDTVDELLSLLKRPN